MKHNLIALSFASLALMVGCEKGENVEGNETRADEKYVTITLDASCGDGTKTVLDGFNVNWTDGDKVSVFIDGGNYEFTADNGGSPSTTFTGEVPESKASYAGDIYAVYPYKDTYAIDDKGVVSGIEIPAVQSLTAGSYDPDAVVSVATGTISGKLTFKNVCTLLKIKLDAETAVRGAQLTCPSGFALAGKGLSVNTADAEITFPTNYAGCTNTVNLINNTKEGVSGAEFYMALVPSKSFGNGDYKLSVFNAEEKFASRTFSTTDDKQLERGKMASIKSAAPANASYVHYGTANCICLYGKAAGEKVTIDVTPYIASDSFIATGLVSYVDGNQANKLATGNVWRESDLTGVTKDGSVSDNSFKISRTDATYGNMSIAFKRSSSIVWSYHVWVPENNPDAVLEHNGYEVMPMALGAINSAYKDNMNLSNLAGLFYQWGRKDPMGRRDFSAADATKPYVECKGTAISAKSIGADADVVSYSVKNPTVIISDNTGSKNNSLWANPAGYNSPKIVSKSIYDPCPEGYMVAPSDVYDNVVTAVNVKNTISGTALDYEAEFARYNGFMFGDDLVSASGARKKDGSFSGDGAAHYWTSTFKSEKSTYPYKIYFGKDTKGAWQFNAKSGGGENAQACCVRCVKVK